MFPIENLSRERVQKVVQRARDSKSIRSDPKVAIVREMDQCFVLVEHGCIEVNTEDTRMIIDSCLKKVSHGLARSAGP